MLYQENATEQQSDVIYRIDVDGRVPGYVDSLLCILFSATIWQAWFVRCHLSCRTMPLDASAFVELLHRSVNNAKIREESSTVADSNLMSSRTLAEIPAPSYG